LHSRGESDGVQAGIINTGPNTYELMRRSCMM
jgi:hypothetical protein